jgi:hypothetical protein
MLQYIGILPTTLELLKSLMKIPSLSDFYLGGGTALSLHLGHRLSIDLDFFIQTDFMPDPINSVYLTLNASLIYILTFQGSVRRRRLFSEVSP